MQATQSDQIFSAPIPANDIKPISTTTFSSCEFLSAITHELKTPLSAIISMAEILAENLATMNSQKNSELFEESKSCIADIASISADMLSLVHDILDVNKISHGNLAGKFSVNLASEINLHDVVKRAVKLNYDYSLKRNVAIKVEISDEVKLVKLDEKRMKQIFTNLISNAVKYSPAGGEVKISAQIKNNFLEICIADQGFGMSESQIQTAFQKFQTIENPNSGSVDSFGLGLPITKQLVELQGGEIFVDSKVGEGTRMRVVFPV
jgi:signal transduction histidine kinase